LDGCKPEGLAALALTSCDFIDDLTGITVTRQSPSSTEQLSDKQEDSSAASAEKPSDSTTQLPAEQAASNGIVESSGSGTVEDNVCIAGAVHLKVHVDQTYVSAQFIIT